MMANMRQQHTFDPITASANGRYDCATLGAFIRRDRQRPCFEHWLQKVIFMRQLGYPLSQARLRQARAWLMLNPLSKWQHRIYGHRLRQLKNLIDEAEHNPDKPAVCRADQRRVRAWRQQQANVLQKLEQKLTQAKRVIVVGNSPNIRGSRQGQWIDSHDLVIRFNHCFSEQTNSVDSGEKLDLWIVAPDYRGPYFTPCTATLLTGPNMLWWRQNWKSLRGQSKPLAGLPLDSWQTAINALQAPPSAGFLVLLWLSRHRATQSISTIGFGFTGTAEYHNAIRGHQAVARHNWQREQELLSNWNLLNNQS